MPSVMLSRSTTTSRRKWKTSSPRSRQSKLESPHLREDILSLHHQRTPVGDNETGPTTRTTSRTATLTVGPGGTITQAQHVTILWKGTSRRQPFTTDKEAVTATVEIRNDGGGTMTVKHSDLKLNTLKNYIFLSNSVIPLNSNLNTNIIADTGCSGHYDGVKPNAILTKSPINVKLPNGGRMTSTHTQLLDIPSLPPEARIQHLFPEMNTTGLLSIG